MIALKAINWTANGGGEDPEEAMYKELFTGLVMDSLPSICVVPENVTDIKRAFCFITSTVTDLTLKGFTTGPFLAQNFLYQADQCKIVRTPNLTECNFNLFQSGNMLEDWYAPSLERFTNQWSLNNTSRSSVNRLHLGKTCDDVMAMQWFPWTNQDSVRQKLKFVCTDGTVSWDGSAWVKS